VLEAWITVGRSTWVATVISYGQANSEVPATPRVIPYGKSEVPRW